MERLCKRVASCVRTPDKREGAGRFGTKIGDAAKYVCASLSANLAASQSGDARAGRTLSCASAAAGWPGRPAAPQTLKSAGARAPINRRRQSRGPQLAPPTFRSRGRENFPPKLPHASASRLVMQPAGQLDPAWPGSEKSARVGPTCVLAKCTQRLRRRALCDICCACQIDRALYATGAPSLRSASQNCASWTRRRWARARAWPNWWKKDATSCPTNERTPGARRLPPTLARVGERKLPNLLKFGGICEIWPKFGPARPLEIETELQAEETSRQTTTFAPSRKLLSLD